jgi:hypothetical protein
MRTSSPGEELSPGEQKRQYYIDGPGSLEAAAGGDQVRPGRPQSVEEGSLAALRRNMEDTYASNRPAIEAEVRLSALAGQADTDTEGLFSGLSRINDPVFEEVKKHTFEQLAQGVGGLIKNEQGLTIGYWLSEQDPRRQGDYIIHCRQLLDNGSIQEWTMAYGPIRTPEGRILE